MKINQKLLNKFNKFQNEILEHYKLDPCEYGNNFVCNGELYTINTFSLTRLGYKFSSVDVNANYNMTPECLSVHLDYLRDNYPLLTPCYAISSFFLQNKIIQKQLKLQPQTFEEINANIKFIRHQKQIKTAFNMNPCGEIFLN